MVAARQPQGRDSWPSASVEKEGWALMSSPQVRTCSLEKRRVGGAAPGGQGSGRQARICLTTQAHDHPVRPPLVLLSRVE